MFKKLAIISGKGGSGKTSFALAIAKTLSDLKIKVLLIDCDMSTHGATFFMKPMIESRKNDLKELVSVDNILLSTDMPPFGFFSEPGANLINNYNNSLFTNISESVLYNQNEKFTYEKLLKVDDYMYFLPSDVSISNSKENDSKYVYEAFKNCVNKEINEEFEVVIFDCQAGYSEFTRNIISISDLCLLVSEPDSVSAAANKALCFQVGIELQDVNCYQLFNKITEEEAKHYSKVTTSAFFANIPPVIFNWSVRKTFLFSKIPSIETVDLDFGKCLLNILQILFPEYQEEIDPIQKRINSLKIDRLELQIEHLEKKEKNEKRVRFLKYLQVVALCGAICLLLLITYFNYFGKLSNNNLLFYATVVLILVEIILLSIKRHSTTITNDELHALQEEFNNLQYEDFFPDLGEKT